MKNVVFVCTGNTCRSPMAEQILKAKLKEEGIDYIKVSSTGLCVNQDSIIDEKAVLALKKYKIPVRRKKSKQITDKIIKNADYIIAMTKNHKNNINSSNVFTLDELVGCGEILDPYMKSQEVYDKLAFTLILYTNKLISKLKNQI